MEQTEKPHSTEYFGDYRDYWWNRDFLELMAKRLHLDNFTTVLDVGCGIGHWGQLLSTVMPASTTFTGVDRETASILEATIKATELGVGKRFTYVPGDANKLPFPDESFDLVTCQTLLIHVADPKVVVSEMLRVLKPSGLIFVAEPNNLASQAVASSLSKADSIQQITDMFYFKLTCERGKEALGLGNISLGDLVPGIFAELAIKDINVFLSDKAVPLFPPYETKVQQVNVAQALEWSERDFWVWDKKETKKYFLAGGGTEAEFVSLWLEATKNSGSYQKALLEERFHTAGGCLMYLVSGLKS